MGLLKKTDCNAKITKIEGKIRTTPGLVTNAALTPVENKIPDISNLVKKTDYDAKILDIKCKYFSTADYNKFTNKKIKQKQLVNKSNIGVFINNSDLNKKVATLATKAE